MSNCSNHSKELFGQTDMKIVAEAIGDLHYEALLILLQHLSTKLIDDSKKDYAGGRNELAHYLHMAGIFVSDSCHNIKKAWEISKPFMKDKPQQ